MSPRRLIEITLGMAAAVLLTAIGFNYIVDPYEVFGTGLLQGHGDINERFTKVQYLKRSSTFDTFLLGSSRVSVLDPRDLDKAIQSAKTFNFTVSQANQWDTEQLTHWLATNQRTLKRIFVQIDWPEVYGGDRPNYELLTTMHPDITGSSMWDFYWPYLSQFNFEAIKLKIDNSIGGDNIAVYDVDRGNWQRPVKDQKIDANCAEYVSLGTFFPTSVNNETAIIQQNLDAIRRYVAFLKSKHIEVVLWLTPHNSHYIDKIDVDKYMRFISGVAEIAPVYNFMLYSRITTDDCNYYEWSHYRPKIGTEIASVVGKGERSSSDNTFLYIDGQFLPQQIEYLRRNFSDGRARSQSH